MKKKRKITIPELLLGFSSFHEYGIKPAIYNCRLLMRHFVAIENSVMLFLLRRTVTQVVETFVLQLHEAWLILNQELRKVGESPLMRDSDYSSLDRIRDEMVGHKVINSLNPANIAWYQKEFGSYEKMFLFIERVADKIGNRIEDLRDSGKLNARVGVSVTVTKEFYEAEVRALENAIRKAGVW